MIDGSVLQSAQRCFEKKSRVVVKMVVTRQIVVAREANVNENIRLTGTNKARNIPQTSVLNCLQEDGKSV